MAPPTAETCTHTARQISPSPRPYSLFPSVWCVPEVVEPHGEDVVAVDADDGAWSWLHEAEEGRRERALARARAAHHPDARPWGDGEAQVGDDVAVAARVAHTQVLHHQLALTRPRQRRRAMAGHEGGRLLRDVVAVLQGRALHRVQVHLQLRLDAQTGKQDTGQCGG